MAATVQAAAVAAPAAAPAVPRLQRPATPCAATSRAASSARAPLAARSGRRLTARRGTAVVAAAAAGGGVCAPPFNVVITGGSKGVGRALAAEFLKEGDNVVICARNADQVAATVEELRSASGRPGAVHGIACNVARAADVAALADFAKEKLGRVDFWINNAGTNAYRVGPLAEQATDDIVAVVETNVIGVMLGCKEAIRVMKDQPGGGHIFNMDGAGADGGATPRFAAYGATKRGLAQLAKSLRSELRSAGLKKIGMHNLSPGMVTTELLLAGTNTPVARWFVNCLAEEPLTVAQYLVPRIRQVPEKSKSPLPWVEGIGQHQYIRFLTNSKAYSQIAARLFTGARKNRFVRED